MVPEYAGTAGPLETKPGVFLIGCPNVGKRTILSRLLSIDIPEVPNLSSGILCQGWTLETKYYSAELSMWTCHLDEGFSFQNFLASKQLAALVMVFDLSDESSFLALKNWVDGIDIGSYEILLCIGNKADLVSDHFAHVEYRRFLQKHNESGGDPHPEFWDYGINGTESYSLLGNEDPSADIKKRCMEWCIELNIEYIEACASNADFDKCLSADGDIQGIERIYGALSAHMWPGMILKAGNRINFPALIEREDSTDNESDYEIEYEVLSKGDDESWDNTDNPSPSSTVLLAGNRDEKLGYEGNIGGNSDMGTESENDTEAFSAFHSPPSPRINLASEEEIEREHCTSKEPNQDQKHEEVTEQGQTSTSELEGQEYADDGVELDDDLQFSYDDLERLMGEIGNMRGNLRLMPDFQRREMAAKLAMKMAAMFGESGDEDGF